MTLLGSDVRRLLFSAAGIIISYTVYGLLMEKIVRDVEISTISMLFVASSLYTFAAWAFGQLTGSPPRVLDQPHEYVKIAASYLGAMWASTAALHNVSYVTQVLAKSGKAMPIMVVGLCRGQKQKLSKWVSVIYVIAGVVSFTLLTKMKASSSSTFTGLLLITISLCLDGVTGTLEDRMVEHTTESKRPGPLDFMFNINLWAMPFCVVVMLVNNEFGQLYQLITGTSSGLQVVGWALSGAVGQLFIFYVISTDGAVVCSIVTTLRKFITVLLSILWFQHPISPSQVVCIVVTFGGVIGLMHSKRSKDMPAREALTYVAGLGFVLAVAHLGKEWSLTGGAGDMAKH